MTPLAAQSLISQQLRSVCLVPLYIGNFDLGFSCMQEIGGSHLAIYTLKAPHGTSSKCILQAKKTRRPRTGGRARPYVGDVRRFQWARKCVSPSWRHCLVSRRTMYSCEAISSMSYDRTGHFCHQATMMLLLGKDGKTNSIGNHGAKRAHNTKQYVLTGDSG